MKSTRVSFLTRKSDALASIEKVSKLTSRFTFPRSIDFYTALAHASESELITLPIPETLLKDGKTAQWVCLYCDERGVVRRVSGEQ